MTDKDVLDIHVLERRKYNLLVEILEHSQQMGTAMDRNDETTFRMVLAMRQEPIGKLEGLKTEIADKLGALTKTEQVHMRKVLAGKTSSTKPEEALKLQGIATAEILEKVLVLDSRLNKRISGEQSVYEDPTTKAGKSLAGTSPDPRNFGQSKLVRPKKVPSAVPTPKSAP